MTLTDSLDEQLNLRVPKWLKAAVQDSATARSGHGVVVTPADVAREVLWREFDHARPKEVTQEVHA